MSKLGGIIVKTILSLIMLDIGFCVYFVLSLMGYTIFNHEGVNNPNDELLSMAEETIGVKFPDDLHISRIEDKNDDWQSHRYDIIRIYSNYTEEQWRILLGEEPCGSDDNYWSYSCEKIKYGRKENYDTCLTLKSTTTTEFRSELISQARANDKYRELKQNVRFWCGLAGVLFFALIPWIPWKAIVEKIRK